MSEASPMPWSIMRFSSEDEPDRIVDANGDEVARGLLEADATLIVDAVNERDRLRDIVRRFLDLFTPGTNHPAGTMERLLREARAAIGEGAATEGGRP